MESFEVETSSRKVLKELVETYVDIQDKQNKKISQLQHEQVSTKNKISQIEQLMKKTRETAEASLTLQKRVNMLVSYCFIYLFHFQYFIFYYLNCQKD